MKRNFNESSFVYSIVNHLSGEDGLLSSPFNSFHQQHPIGGLGEPITDLYNDCQAMSDYPNS